jgi:acyl-ACP thioesterase
MPEIVPILEEKLVIPSYFVDDQAQLSPNSLFCLLQEMSDNHTSLLGAGWHDLHERGFFWVITKIQLKINRLPKWREPVTLRSWVRKSNAATSPREYEMLDADGNLLLAGSSIWAILDAEQSRPQRMDMFDGCFLPQDRCAIDCKPPKISALKLPDILPNRKEVVHSDLDMNRHVNNTHYIQWAFDTVDESFRQRHKLTGITVNFLSQAKLGDHYSVYSQQISDTTFQTTLFSSDDRTEFCRLLFSWDIDR